MNDVDWRSSKSGGCAGVVIGLVVALASAAPAGAATCDWIDPATAAKFATVAANCPGLLAEAAVGEPAAAEAPILVTPSSRPASVAIAFGNLSQPARVRRGVSDRFASSRVAAGLSAPGPAGLIDVVAASHRIDPLLLGAIVARESAGRADAVSAKGAVGLMQVMPATARALGVTDPAQLRDPATSLIAGATYLKQMQARFGSDLALTLAAYNAGPAAVARHRGVPPYAETRAYVAAILARYRAARAAVPGAVAGAGR